MFTFLAQSKFSHLVGILFLCSISDSLLYGSEGNCSTLPLPAVKEEPDCHFLLKYFFADELKSAQELGLIAQLIAKVPKELQYNVSSYLAELLVGTMVLEKPSREITVEPNRRISMNSFEFCDDDSHILFFGTENRLGQKTVLDQRNRTISLETRAHVVPFSSELLRTSLTADLYREIVEYVSNSRSIEGCSLIDLAQDPSMHHLMYPSSLWNGYSKEIIKLSNDKKLLGLLLRNAFIILTLDDFRIITGRAIRFFDQEPVEDHPQFVRIPTENCENVKDLDYIEDFSFTPEGALIILTNSMKCYKVQIPENADGSGLAHLVLIHAHPTFKDKKFKHEYREDNQKLVISATMAEYGALFRLNTGIKPRGTGEDARNFHTLVWWNYQDNTCTQFMQEEHAFSFYGRSGDISSQWYIKNGLIVAWLTRAPKFDPRYPALSRPYEEEIRNIPYKDKIAIFNTATQEVITFFPRRKHSRDVSLSPDGKFLNLLLRDTSEIYFLPSEKCVAYVREDIDEGSCRFNNAGTMLATFKNGHTFHLWNVTFLKQLLPLYEVKLTLLQSLFILFIRDLRRQSLTLRGALPLLAQKYGISEDGIRASLNKTYCSFNGPLKVYVCLIARTASLHEEKILPEEEL